jgi:hypothetical protein
LRKLERELRCVQLKVPTALRFLSGPPGIVGFVERPPYTSISDIDAFFERVQTIAEPKPPKKVDSAWVESYQFQTAHPSAIPAMLRWLGVIDENAESTGVWNDLRVDGTRQATLARLVKEAYKAVFDTVDVEKATARDLRGAFVSAYSIGDPGRHIKCFLALCAQAGITTAEEAKARESKDSDAKPKPKAQPVRSKVPPSVEPPSPERQAGRTAAEPGAFTVTLNVEIPADWSEEQIRERIAAVTRSLASNRPG